MKLQEVLTAKKSSKLLTRGIFLNFLFFILYMHIVEHHTAQMSTVKSVPKKQLASKLNNFLF